MTITKSTARHASGSCINSPLPLAHHLQLKFVMTRGWGGSTMDGVLVAHSLDRHSLLLTRLPDDPSQCTIP